MLYTSWKVPPSEKEFHIYSLFLHSHFWLCHIRMQELVAFPPLTWMKEVPFQSRMFDLFNGILTMLSFWVQLFCLWKREACSLNNKLSAISFKSGHVLCLTAIFCISSRNYILKKFKKTPLFVRLFLWDQDTLTLPRTTTLRQNWG